MGTSVVVPYQASPGRGSCAICQPAPAFPPSQSSIGRGRVRHTSHQTCRMMRLPAPAPRRGKRSPMAAYAAGWSPYLGMRAPTPLLFVVLVVRLVRAASAKCTPAWGRQHRPAQQRTPLASNICPATMLPVRVQLPSYHCYRQCLVRRHTLTSGHLPLIR